MNAWDYMLWGALLVQIAVLVLAMRAYLVRRTRAFALLLAACICLVIARTSWFVFPFGAGLFIGRADRGQRLSVMHWSERIDIAFQLLCFIFFVGALLSFIRERRVDATGTI